MTATATQGKRPWLPLVAAAVALVFGAALVAYALVEGRGGGIFRTRPAIPQARWRVAVFVAGQRGKPKKVQRARVRAQAPKLAGVVKNVYDALFLDPDAAPRVVRQRFLPAAAKSFLSTRAGVPARSDEVRTRKRIAKIGVHPRSAAFAAAVVRIVARATLGKRPVRVVHRATLWLQRTRSRWRVIGFAVTQRRTP